MPNIHQWILSRARAVWLSRFPVVEPTIISVEAHDNRAFTQGLAFAGSTLFESTGLHNASSVRRLASGSVEPELIKPLWDHWGEGIAHTNGKITQLTWKSGLAFVYTCPDLDFLKVMQYAGEGWGLAAVNDGFVMTDGSEWLTFRDAAFNVTRKIKVRIRGLPLKWLNDLEYAAGHIYANRFGDYNIYEIDSDDGSVSRIIDCSDLVTIADPHGPDDGLNGIAFLAEKELFALTGKRWSKLFYVRIPGVKGR
jgi:glutaminyl-peptide cyclotransferase